MNTALVFLALLGLSFAAVYEQEIREIETVRSKKMRDGTWAEHLRLKRLRQAISLKSGSQPVRDYDDLGYIADVTLGTPGQVFRVILDTGSADAWVPDESCSSSSCSKKHKFESGKSSTYKKLGKRWSIRYGTGSASGVTAEDKFCFGGKAAGSLCVEKQVFGQASSIASFFARLDYMDGIVGLAYEALSEEGFNNPFLDLVPQLDNPYFTVWMEHRSGKGKVGGQFTYGALDTKHCEGKPAWVDLSRKLYYQFDIEGISAGDYSKKKKMSVISDTGTSLLVGPRRYTDGLAKPLGGKYDFFNGVYKVDCSTDGKPDIVITINGNDYAIPAVDYIVNLGSMCVLGFSPGNFAGSGIDWILGDTFIRAWCQVYDPINNKIGFAKAKMDM